MQGKRSEQPPEPLDSDLAQLLWQELGAKCVYASTVRLGGGIQQVLLGGGGSLVLGRGVNLVLWQDLGTKCVHASTMGWVEALFACFGGRAKGGVFRLGLHLFHLLPIGGCSTHSVQGWWWYEVCY